MNSVICNNDTIITALKLLREVVESPKTRQLYNQMDIHTSISTIQQIRHALVKLGLRVGSRPVDWLDCYELKE